MEGNGKAEGRKQKKVGGEQNKKIGRRRRKERAKRRKAEGKLKVQFGFAPSLQYPWNQKLQFLEILDA